MLMHGTVEVILENVIVKNGEEKLLHFSSQELLGNIFISRSSARVNG